MTKSFPAICIALTGMFAFTGCETPGQSALLGAGTGAIIGNNSRAGALRGAAIGAGAGYLIGKLVQRDRRREYEEGYADGSGSRSRYPVGLRTRSYGLVRSPYAPNNLIDVRDIPPGARVIDPSCDRIFINP